MEVNTLKNDKGEVINHSIPRYCRRKIFDDNIYNIYDYGYTQSNHFADYFYVWQLGSLGINYNSRDSGLVPLSAFQNFDRDFEEIKQMKAKSR